MKFKLNDTVFFICYKQVIMGLIVEELQNKCGYKISVFSDEWNKYDRNFFTRGIESMFKTEEEAEEHLDNHQ